MDELVDADIWGCDLTEIEDFLGNPPRIPKYMDYTEIESKDVTQIGIWSCNLQNKNFIFTGKNVTDVVGIIPCQKSEGHIPSIGQERNQPSPITNLNRSVKAVLRLMLALPFFVFDGKNFDS